MLVPASAVADGLFLSKKPVNVFGYNLVGTQFDSPRASGAGDVNGDGVDDFLIAAPGDSSEQFAVYVVFGGQRLTGVDVSGTNWRGFKIAGNPALGTAVRAAGAGDINGDGLEDILVGTPGATRENRTEAGAAFLVYGKADHAAVDLANLDAWGVTLLGAQGSQRDGVSGDGFGASVAGAGDVNGDGRDDFVLSSPGAVEPYPAQVHVVLGGALPRVIDMRDFDNGWQMANAEPPLGVVSGAGDFNGDGLADVMVAEPRANLAGRVSVVFGSRADEDVDLAESGERGIRIEAAPEFSGPGGVPRPIGLGTSVASAGDFNNDGFADVVVGAPASYEGAGAAYLVYGQNGDADLDAAELGARGFEVRGVLATREDHGPGRTEALGQAVVGDFDLNSDGRPDLGLGAPWTRGETGAYDGRAYVLYGGPKYPSLTTAALPASALRIEDSTTTQTGGRIAAGQDVTDNGRDELLFVTRAILAAEPPPLRLRNATRRMKRGAVRLPITCRPAERNCAGDLKLVARVRKMSGSRARAVIGSARLGLESGERARVRVKLSNRGRRTVRRQRRTRARLVARIGGFTQRERVLLLPPRR